MSHDFHQGPDDAVIYDDCRECDERAKDPLEALLYLDADRFELLRQRMIGMEIERNGDHYRTGNEGQLGRALYRIYVLEQRNGTVFR